MRIDWILSPLAIYGALAAGLCCCVYLFLSINAELNALDRRVRSELAAIRNSIDEVRKALASRDAESAERTAALASATPKDSINLSKRSQALRMHRRGETAEAIAAALGLAQSEVDLILKVQKIVLDSVGAGKSGSGQIPGDSHHVS